jgi:hypothetical protein
MCDSDFHNERYGVKRFSALITRSQETEHICVAISSDELQQTPGAHKHVFKGEPNGGIEFNRIPKPHLAYPSLKTRNF